jgi:hypothetical protein
MLLVVFQDTFVMQVTHLLMLYGFGSVVWHDLRLYAEEGVSNETGTVKQSQMAKSSLIFTAHLNM